MKASWGFAFGLAAAICFTGCAHQGAQGGAPGAVSGSARSDDSKNGEFYRTETLTPGVGSALFPDPR